MNKEAFAWLLTLCLMLIGLYQIDVVMLLAILGESNVEYLIFSFLFFVLSSYFRSLRFLCIDTLKDLGVLQAFSISALHGFFNYMLPMKSGELSIPILLKRVAGVGVRQGIGSLLVFRLFDMVVVVIVGIVTCTIFMEKLSFLGPYLVPVGLVILAGVIGGGVVAGRIQVMVSQNLGGVKVLRSLFLTILVWFCVYANFYFLMLGLGIEGGFFESVLILLVMIPMSLLPVQGAANVGTHEFAWVSILSVSNYTLEQGAYYAISSHLILLVYVLLLGFMGGVILKRCENDRKAQG